MGHGITARDLQQGRTMAWHGLTDVKEDLSLDNCWLAKWDVKPEVLKVGDEETPFRILRSFPNEEWDDDDADTDNGLVGKPFDPDTYKPFTNASFLKQLKEGTIGEDLKLDSIGAICERTRIFASFEMGLSYRAAGREFRPFLNVGNSHDQSSPLWVNTSNTCTVCNNTFTLNMSLGGTVWGVKHTKHSAPKMRTLGMSITAMLEGHTKFKAEFEALGMMPVSQNDARAFFVGLLGTPDAELSTRTENTVDRLMQLFRGGAGNHGRDWADLFSAVTDFYTHEAANGAGTPDANWKNFLSSEFGNGKKEKLGVWGEVTSEAKRNARIAIGRSILGGGAMVTVL
jgi:hypothetical protein